MFVIAIACHISQKSFFFYVPKSNEFCQTGQVAISHAWFNLPGTIKAFCSVVSKSFCDKTSIRSLCEKDFFFKAAVRLSTIQLRAVLC